MWSERQNQEKRFHKRWLLLLFLLLLAPLLISKFRKQPPKPKFYIQAAPNNATNPATFATSVAYSPDGKTLACAFAVERRREVVRDQLRRQVETQIRLYDAQTGAYRQKLQVVPGVVRHLEFSPDKNTLRGICENEFTHWWNVDTGEIAHSINHYDAYPIAFSSDGRWQIACREAKTSPFNDVILLRDNQTGKTVRRMNLGNVYVTSAAFSPDNQEFVLVISEDMNETVYFYRTSDFKLLRTQNWNTGDIFWMQFIDQSHIIGTSRRLFMWHDKLKTSWFQSLKGNDRDYINGAISIDKQLVAAGGSRFAPPWQSHFAFEYTGELDPNANFGHASIWQINTGKCVWDKQTGGKNVVSIALSPDNSQVAVATEDTLSSISSQPRGHVEVWELPDNIN